MKSIDILPLNEKIYGMVPNENKCTNFGAIATNGTCLWGLKTNQSNTMSTLYIFQDIRNLKNYTTRKYSFKMGHGNGMTYNRITKELVIAPLDKYVVLLDTINNYKRKKIKAPITISNIAHVVNEYYISGNHELAINGGGISFRKINRIFDVDERLKEYNIGQDIGYNNGYIYVIKSHNTKRGNVIYRFPAYESEPDIVYKSDRPVEFESLAFSGNHMYIAVNSEKGDYILTACVEANK